RGVRTTRLRRPRQHDSSSAPPTSTASRPASVTIAIRPCRGRDGEASKSDLGQARTEIFLQMGLDRANHVDPLQQIKSGARRLDCFSTTANGPLEAVVRL